MSIRKLTEHAKDNGISVDEYAAHLMDTTEACNNALSELSRYVDKIKQEAESLRAGFEATMKAKGQEVEHWRTMARGYERGIVAMGAACDELRQKVEHWRGKVRELEGVTPRACEACEHFTSIPVECMRCGPKYDSFQSVSVDDEDAAIIEQAEREEGFHGQ